MQDVIPLSTPNRKEFNNRRVVSVPIKRKPDIEHGGDDIFSDSPSVSIESGDDWSFRDQEYHNKPCAAYAVGIGQFKIIWIYTDSREILHGSS